MRIELCVMALVACLLAPPPCEAGRPCVSSRRVAVVQQAVPVVAATPPITQNFFYPPSQALNGGYSPTQQLALQTQIQQRQEALVESLRSLENASRQISPRSYASYQQQGAADPRDAQIRDLQRQVEWLRSVCFEGHGRDRNQVEHTRSSYRPGREQLRVDISTDQCKQSRVNAPPSRSQAAEPLPTPGGDCASQGAAPGALPPAPGASAIRAHCTECHSGVDAKKGLRLDRLEDLSPTQRENAIRRIKDGTMPPKERRRLTEAEALRAAFELLTPAEQRQLMDGHLGGLINVGPN